MTVIPDIELPRPPDPPEGDPGAGYGLAVTVFLTLDHLTPDASAAVRKLVERLAVAVDPATRSTVRLVESPTTGPDPAEDPNIIRLDPLSRVVTRAARAIPLCRREFDLLLFFAEHPGQVFTRGQLLNAVWEDTFTGPRTVDVHIRRLRQKLGTRQPLVTTVRGVGYRLATDAPITLAQGPSRVPHRAAAQSAASHSPADHRRRGAA